MSSAEPTPPVVPEPGCPFCGILAGTEAGTIIARDEARRFALIQSIHPESNVHWMAIPYEHVPGTETMENADGKRFLDLMNFAISEVRARRDEYPQLYRGFSIKMHFGSFETIEHAKIHVLAAE
jgi:histidine triad (HIT) family protein